MSAFLMNQTYLNSPSSGSFDGLPFAATGAGASFMPAVNAGNNNSNAGPSSPEPGSPYRGGDGSPGRAS